MGRLFGKFRPLRTLVASAAGEVHLAFMDSAGASRKVVLKVLAPPATPERVENFLREARATSSTFHPSLLRPIDFGQEGDRCYVALEPLVGVTLTEMIAASRKLGRRIPFEFVAAVASQICAGLAHAHSRAAPDGTPLRLVHCDIGPQHLLACEGGLVKLLGFARARAMGLQVNATRAGLTSALYLAPEQFSGRREPDGRADLFSLGAVLWELVAGKPPFAARTLAEIADALEQPAVPLTLVVRDVPLDLADSVARSLELDPDSRFSNADEMRRAFDSVLARRGAHHPTTVIDAELKNLQRAGAPLVGFEAGPLPPWFLDSLGFDPSTPRSTGPLPEGTDLESNGRVYSDGAPTQVVTDQPGVSLPSAPAGPGTPPAVTPEEAWGLDAVAGAAPAPSGAPPARPPAATRPHDDDLDQDQEPSRRSGAGRTAAFVLVAALASGAAGYVGPRLLGRGGEGVPSDSPGPSRAAIEVVSTPSGARVWLDGLETGKTTPVRLEVEPGRKHLVVLRHPDCLEWTLEVEPKASEPAQVEAGLVKAARISATSEPPGAQVELDEAPGFVTPGQSGPLKAGTHKLTVRKPGFLVQKREVAVRDADALQLSFPLVAAAEVSVKSVPPGAEIWVDGEDTGTKTPGAVGVPAGKPHVVAVRKPGFVGQARRLPVLEAGQTAAVELALENVVAAELVKRVGGKVRDRGALEKRRDEAKKKLAVRKSPAAEKERADAEAALEDLAVELQDLQLQLRAHENIRR